MKRQYNFLSAQELAECLAYLKRQFKTEEITDLKQLTGGFKNYTFFALYHSDPVLIKTPSRNPHFRDIKAQNWGLAFKYLFKKEQIINEAIAKANVNIARQTPLAVSEDGNCAIFQWFAGEIVPPKMLTPDRLEMIYVLLKKLDQVTAPDNLRYLLDLSRPYFVCYTKLSDNYKLLYDTTKTALLAHLDEFAAGDTTLRKFLTKLPAFDLTGTKFTLQHGDLQLRNILFTPENQAVLIDNEMNYFGLAGQDAWTFALETPEILDFYLQDKTLTEQTLKSLYWAGCLLILQALQITREKKLHRFTDLKILIAKLDKIKHLADAKCLKTAPVK